MVSSTNGASGQSSSAGKVITSIPVSFSKRDDGSYDLTGVPEEMQATVEEICKQHDAAIQKAAELEEILKAERDERLRRDFVEKAEKEYANLPGTPVEIGLFLCKVRPDVYMPLKLPHGHVES